MATLGPRGRDVALALSLSISLAVALFYVTFEVPLLLDESLRGLFPDVAFDKEALEGILRTLRPVGYAALAVTVLAMAAGLALGRRPLALAGSLALYLPVFGYFALSMFFLAGLGVLRALWLPLLDASPSVLKLGCVAYAPLSVVPGATALAMALSLAGLLVFCIGAVSWLYGRARGMELVDFWAYRYSRHPQYLGYLLWSYGLLVYVAYKPYVRGALTIPPALIWLVTALVVVGVALLEELEMARRLGCRYEEYRRRTPFMMPLPRPLRTLVSLPLMLVRGLPRSARDVALVLTVYATILVALSYVLARASFC